MAATDDLIAAPRHPYTQVLLDSVAGDGNGRRAPGGPVNAEPPDPS